MKPARTLKTVKAALLVAGIAFTMACGYSHSTMPGTTGSMPTITSFTPTAVDHTDANATPLTVNGTHFNSGLYAAFVTVTFNGTSTKMTTSIGGSASASTATISIPSGFFPSSGMAQVTVTNPATPAGYNGGGTTAVPSAPMSLTVN
jgi:hypothetical protein